MNKLIIFFIALLASVSAAFAQYELPFGFEKQFNVAVIDDQGNGLADAFTGYARLQRSSSRSCSLEAAS